MSSYGTINANVVNYGEIDTVLDAPTPLYVYGDYTQLGGVTNVVDGTTLDVYSGANGGGNFNLDNGNVFVDGYATLAVTADYQQTGGLLQTNNAAITVGADVDLNGGETWLTYGPGLASGGALTVSGGMLEVDYTTAGFAESATIGGQYAGLVELDGGELAAQGVAVTGDGKLTGTGTVNSSLTNAGEVDAAPDGYGLLTITGSLTQTAGVVNVSNSSSSNATLAVGGGITENAGNANLNGGATIEAGINILLGAVFSGYGNLAGDITNAGSMNIVGSMYGSLVMGVFTQTSTGVLTLDLTQGYGGGISANTANLGGGLVLSCPDGFTPGPGYEIDPVEANTLNGGFATLAMPAPSSGSWYWSYIDPNTEFRMWVQA
jgi:hypothetical protein